MSFEVRVSRKFRRTFKNVIVLYKPESLGPCARCEWPETHAYCGTADNLECLCELCAARFNSDLVRMPEFYVI